MWSAPQPFLNDAAAEVSFQRYILSSQPKLTRNTLNRPSGGRRHAVTALHLGGRLRAPVPSQHPPRPCASFRSAMATRNTGLGSGHLAVMLLSALLRLRRRRRVWTSEEARLTAPGVGKSSWGPRGEKRASVNPHNQSSLTAGAGLSSLSTALEQKYCFRTKIAHCLSTPVIK